MLRNYMCRTLGLLVMALVLMHSSCTKWDDYKKYTKDGEIVYPSKASGVEAHPGNGRVLLAWEKQIDESVNKYIVFWNNGNDSSEVDASSFKVGDTIKHYIDNLGEYTYTFTIYSYDKDGNKSVASEIPPVTIYGARYHASLLNRPVKSLDFSSETSILTIGWGVPDTINLKTEINYIDHLNREQVLSLAPEDETVSISWKVGSKIYYTSTYLPMSSAIDSFEVIEKDSIVVENVLLGKSAWEKVNLPHDIDGDGYGTNLSFLWDGQLGGYPNIYHSEGGSLPHHFTIDLGGVYELTTFEEAGRQDCACHNPVEFEVWGIADLSGAATDLPGDDAAWADESSAKGWTLLKTVQRSDDGISPIKVNLDEGIPPVRYIRIRVLKTLDDSVESHMSEISFWYNP